MKIGISITSWCEFTLLVKGDTNSPPASGRNHHSCQRQNSTSMQESLVVINTYGLNIFSPLTQSLNESESVPLLCDWGDGNRDCVTRPQVTSRVGSVSYLFTFCFHGLMTQRNTLTAYSKRRLLRDPVMHYLEVILVNSPRSLHSVCPKDTIEICTSV